MIRENKNKKQGKSQIIKVFLYVLTGSLAGVANGLFGGGGGMIVVPMLIFFLNYKPNVAHATAILIILPLSILSGVLYASFGIVNWKILIQTGIGVIAGGVIGALLLSKISSKWLIVIFSIVMAFAGGKMLFF